MEMVLNQNEIKYEIEKRDLKDGLTIDIITFYKDGKWQAEASNPKDSYIFI
jgi:hypothetical protein